MSAQLRLFPVAKPLVDRLGQEFFKAAPRSPGVYFLRGSGDRILYIGQSKNLRTRLSFYKNANPDRLPRRLIQLLHQVESIIWDPCPSASAARERELEMLRFHRPRFNRADTGPEQFHFLEFEAANGMIRIQLHFGPPELPGHGGNWRGPFRGRMIPALALGALQRLWIAADRGIVRCADLPLLPKRLSSLELPTTEFTGRLTEFLSQGSDELALELIVPRNREPEPALRQLQQNDSELLLSWAKLLREAP